MGYYTDYDLSDNPPEVIEQIELESGYTTEEGIAYEVKWYGFQKDMKKVSLMFPDQILTAEGKGEDSGDIWRAYFKNGKMQMCRATLTFEDYDENKLK